MANKKTPQIAKWWFQKMLAQKRLQECLKSFAKVVNQQCQKKLTLETDLLQGSFFVAISVSSHA